MSARNWSAGQIRSDEARVHGRTSPFLSVNRYHELDADRSRPQQPRIVPKQELPGTCYETDVLRTVSSAVRLAEKRARQPHVAADER